MLREEKVEVFNIMCYRRALEASFMNKHWNLDIKKKMWHRSLLERINRTHGADLSMI